LKKEYSGILPLASQETSHIPRQGADIPRSFHSGDSANNGGQTLGRGGVVDPDLLLQSRPHDRPKVWGDEIEINDHGVDEALRHLHSDLDALISGMVKRGLLDGGKRVKTWEG